MYIPYIHISSLSHINHDTSYIIESYTYIISYICVYMCIYIYTYIHIIYIYIYTYTYHTMWLPPVISWLTKAPVTSSCTHQVLPGESHRSFGPDQGHRSSPVGVGWCRMGGTVGPGYWWFFMLAMDYIYDMYIYIYDYDIYDIYDYIYDFYILDFFNCDKRWLCGYGSIPYMPFLGGWTSILTQLFWCEQKGYKVLTHCHMVIFVGGFSWWLNGDRKWWLFMLA